MLITEIEAADPSDDYYYPKLLLEMIKHHVNGEEPNEGMSDEAKQARTIDLSALGLTVFRPQKRVDGRDRRRLAEPYGDVGHRGDISVLSLSRLAVDPGRVRRDGVWQARR